MSQYGRLVEQRQRDVTGVLLRAGVRMEPRKQGSSIPMWRIESGHTVGVSYHPDWGYAYGVTHYGDPSGDHLSGYLNTHNADEVPGRLTQEFRHPETLGHLRDMHLRASVNNDPAGTEPHLQRQPRDMAPDPQTIHVDHDFPQDAPRREGL